MTNRHLATFVDEMEPLMGLLNRCCSPARVDSSGVSVGETEEMVFVDLPLPGVSKEKIQIVYEKGSLLVKAEEEEEKSETKYHVKASRAYAFRVPIPSRVDEQGSPEATYKDGILRVKFQKSRSARPLKINIV